MENEDHLLSSFSLSSFGTIRVGIAISRQRGEEKSARTAAGSSSMMKRHSTRETRLRDSDARACTHAPVTVYKYTVHLLPASFSLSLFLSLFLFLNISLLSSAQLKARRHRPLLIIWNPGSAKFASSLPSSLPLSCFSLPCALFSVLFSSSLFLDRVTVNGRRKFVWNDRL